MFSNSISSCDCAHAEAQTKHGLRENTPKGGFFPGFRPTEPKPFIRMSAELVAGGVVLAAAAGMIIWAEHSGVTGTSSKADLHRLGTVLIGPAWQEWVEPAGKKECDVLAPSSPMETPAKIFNAPDSPPRLPVKAHILFEEGDEPPGAVELLQQQVDEMAAVVNEHAQMRSQLERQLEAEMTLRREAEEKESLARAELLRHKREAERELDKERQTVQELQAHMQALAAANPGEPPPMVIRQKQAELDTEKRKTARAEADVRRLRSEMEAAADQHAKEITVANGRLEEAQRAAQRSTAENLQLRRKLREQSGPVISMQASAAPMSPRHPSPTTYPPPSPSSAALPTPSTVSPAVLWGQN